MVETQSNSLLNKLAGEAKAAKKENRKQIFRKVVVYLDADAKEHFAKKYDAQGKALKDEKGNDLREEVSDGWTYTFSEVGTSKVVKVVYPKKVKLDMMKAYVVSGFGYNIVSGNMIFIDERGKIVLYQ